MRVAVVGGGVSGLAAAHRLRALLGDRAAITVCEAGDVLGGKLRTVELAGRSFDVGAEAFLARRPEAVDLARELGLEAELTHPTGAKATVRAGGRTVPLPAGTVMGVPASRDAVAGVLSAEGGERVAAEPSLPRLELAEDDVSLGGLLRRRFGDELVDRLVDPLLGGVYAGGADGLGLRATLPALAAALDAGAGSLTEAASRQLPATPGTSPVFATLTGGLGTLVAQLEKASAAHVRRGAPVLSLARLPEGGWRLTFGDGGPLEADAVLLAVPPPAARRLLADVAPEASAAFAGVELASMAVVALALPPGTDPPRASGVLIGQGERHADGRPFTAKAFTFSARKWAHHLTEGLPVLIRGSVGRFGETESLRATDAELVRLVRDDLAALTGITAEPVDALVHRWGGGLPQYGTGHTERVARIERAVAAVPGLEVAGAALHGVGIPACVATAEVAARRLVGR
ncbi:protoporphyrinogen oxidase [Prauserella muralis]|uniref:Coproporphyrinogen III oxidase n=1 Tax=Prauserella muralis TaxID=588067 RepID=A0A2V4B2H7_9PSEU|nr:protoporphyrinogen oxidase [Prauserella muralis]PXY28192.1 protoporphyrinogen oxidase [Prauserella muralis]TWE21993.1 oxygen-dependent protoporphyrinogen oxidase [Prauserella muralis]